MEKTKLIKSRVKPYIPLWATSTITEVLKKEQEQEEIIVKIKNLDSTFEKEKIDINYLYTYHYLACLGLKTKESTKLLKKLNYETDLIYCNFYTKDMLLELIK